MGAKYPPEQEYVGGPTPATSTTSKWVLRCCVAVVTCLLSIGAAVQAAAPTVPYLYPAGGQRGTTVIVKVADNPLKPVPLIWCNDPDLKIAFAEDAKTISVEIPADSPPGVRWMRFYNAEGPSIPRPFVVGLIPEVAEVEPNNRISSAQPITAATVCVNGILHAKNENDSYRLKLKAGQTLVASMEANRTIGSPMDAVLQLVSDTGSVLSQNDDDKGFDPQVVFTAANDGEFIVRTFAFPSVPNSTVGFSGGKDYVYRLTLTTGPFLNHAVPISVDASADVDSPPQFQVYGWNLPGSEPKSVGTEPSELRLINESDGSRSLFAADTANSVTLSAPRSTQTRHQLQAKVTSMTLPTTLNGTIDSAGVANRFSFSGKKGQRIVATVHAKSLGSKLDAVLKLTGSDGKVIQEVDDSTRKVADCTLSTKLPADGQYELAVFDRFEHAGFRYFYAIDVSEPIADFSLSSETDLFTVSLDKPLTVSVDINRDGFTEDIAVSVAGLPEGVTCSAVTSAGKGDTAKKIDLKISATRTNGWSGPIFITGESANGGMVRKAAATTVGVRKLNAWWLTVLAGK